MRAAVVMAVVVAALAALAACAGHWIPTATDADAARISARWPGTTAAELNHGRKLMLGHCGNCHRPPSPADKTAADWGPQVDQMASRAGLSSSDARMVERYLAAFARDQDVARR